MSPAPLIASVFLVLVALNAAALIVIRRLWPLRAPFRSGASPWVEDGDVLVRHPASPPEAAAILGGPPARTARPDAPPSSEVRSTVRAARWRRAGLLAGAAGAVVVMTASDSVRGAMVAAPVFGVGVLAGTLVGELGMAAPTGLVRRADLRTRRSSDYVPRALGALVVVAAVALFVLVAATTAVRGWSAHGASVPILVCTLRLDEYGGGLWPGARNAIPTLSVVLLGLVLAALALRRVVRRPRWADVVQFDDVSRRRSAEVVTAAAGVLVLAPLTGSAGAAGLVASVLGDACGVSTWSTAGMALSGLALVAFLATAWCGALLLMPSAPPADRESA